jgi:hypothetical protein
VDAAQLLADTGDHVNAQLLLQHATELNPASTKIRDLQIRLALEKLRTFLLLDRDGQYMKQLTVQRDSTGVERLDFVGSSTTKHTFEEINVEELVRLLARGVVSAEGSERATLLAHLGWMDLLRAYGPVDFDVDRSFIEALQSDTDNPYANAMYGAWLLSPRNKSPVKMSERVKQSREHFKKSLSSHTEKAWVKALWLEALIQSDGLASEQELLLVLQMFKDAGDQFDKYGPAGVALKTNFINSASYGHAPDESNEQRFQSLLSAFAVDDLFTKLHWLSTLRYGCVPSPGCEINNQEMQNLLYISGRLHEASDKLDNAVENYRLAQTSGFRKNFVDKVAMQHLEYVLNKQSVPLRLVVAIWNSRVDALQEQDLILDYHGNSISKEDELSTINSQLEPDQQVQIKILRDGQILEMNSDPLWPRDVIAYVIPESLIKLDKADQLKAWLTNKSAKPTSVR